MSSVLAQTRLILRNDLRLLWRDLGAGHWGSLTRNVGLIGFFFFLANALSIGIFFLVDRQPPLGAETVVWLLFGFLMLGAAMNQAISVLFERADFDLLLASPVSPRAILLARLATMTCGAALSSAFFLVPLFNGALLAVSWRYSAGYAVWLLLSCIVASGGVWFTLLLVKWLGPRRARVWAQVVAAVLGASLYLITQGQNFLPHEARAEFMAQASQVVSHPAVSFIARAGRGEWLPLLALGGIALTFAAMTTRILARMFVGGVQEAAGIAPPKQQSRRHYVFAGGVSRVTFWKDLRLIRRDPLLLAQVLPMALYILPALFGLQRFGGVGLLAPVALIVAAQFSSALTTVAAAGEECWDLIRMSPTPERQLRLAKMAAGMALPLGLSTILCVALALLGRPGLALVALIFSCVTAAGCSWLQVARIKPTPRKDILKRGSRATDVGRGIMTAMLMLIGAGGLGFAAAGHWMVATVLLGILTLSVIACFTLVTMEEIKQPGSPASLAFGGGE